MFVWWWFSCERRCAFASQGQEDAMRSSDDPKVFT